MGWSEEVGNAGWISLKSSWQWAPLCWAIISASAGAVPGERVQSPWERRFPHPPEGFGAVNPPGAAQFPEVSPKLQWCSSSLQHPAGPRASPACCKPQKSRESHLSSQEIPAVRSRHRDKARLDVLVAQGWWRWDQKSLNCVWGRKSGELRAKKCQAQHHIL